MNILGRMCCSTCGQYHRPTECAIRNTVTHFETLQSLLDTIRSSKLFSACSNENIAAVAESVAADLLPLTAARTDV